MTDSGRVQSYYAAFDEWSQLESPEGKLEYRISLHLLEHYLPDESKVLDLGGGPGRYTIALAEAGHRVILAEPSANQIATARKKVSERGLEERVTFCEGIDARDLSAFRDASFDSVLALGPFYHLTEADERSAAAAEIARVLRPDGPLFGAFIPRWSGVAHLIWRAAIFPDQVGADTFSSAYETGAFSNKASAGFQEGYFATAEAIERLFSQAGIEHMETASLQGFAKGKEADLETLERSDPELFETIMQKLLESRNDPQTVAFGGHAMYIGRRR
jgi:ubiquinone/menaquinone biosynthesis C-methylase UbiE